MTLWPNSTGAKPSLLKSASQDQKALSARQHGRTGCRSSMRGLRHTGIMHDRVPMVAAKLVHQPRRAAPLELASAKVELGNTYPQPIVDHKAGRQRALAASGGIQNA